MAILEDLPDDVVEFILQKLPTNSIWAAITANQRWRRIISSPEFIEKHLLENSYTSTKLIVANVPRADFYSYGDDGAVIGHQGGNNLLPAYSYTLPPNQEIKGSCNGLLMIYNEQEQNTYLDNPLTGETLILPDSDVDFPTRDRTRKPFGFFYDTVDLEFKILRSNEDVYEAQMIEILYLKSFHWEPWVKDVPFAEILDSQIDLRGLSHWLGTTNDRRMHLMIVTFDAHDEQFGSIAVPLPVLESAHPSTWWVEEEVRLLAVENSLCLTYMSAERMYEFWFMTDYGVPETWLRRYTIHTGERITPIGFGKNNEFLYAYYDLGDELFASYLQNFQETERQFGVHANVVSEGFNYVPTLGLLDILNFNLN